MEKRGYLTKIDLLILKKLKDNNFGVLELNKQLGIPHKTIKMRLDHLKEFKIISHKQNGRKQENFIIQNKKGFVELVLRIFKFI